MLVDDAALARRLEREMGLALTVVMADRAIELDRLTPGERVRWKALAGTPRREPWLRGRAALKRLLRELGEHEDTARLSFPNARVSLTHSGALALAVGTSSSGLSGIGVDLELDRWPSDRSAQWFLTPQECAWVMRRDASARPYQLRRLWTIKEAAFKADPANHQTWFTDYRLDDPGADSGWARVVHLEEMLEIRYACDEVTRGALAVAICAQRRARGDA